MDDTWNRVKALEGKTLRTVSRGESFVIDAVESNRAVITPVSSRKPRSVRRAVIEDAVSLGLRQQEITPSVLANRVATTDRNLSYVAAIVRAIRER